MILEPADLLKHLYKTAEQRYGGGGRVGSHFMHHLLNWTIPSFFIGPNLSDMINYLQGKKQI